MELADGEENKVIRSVRTGRVRRCRGGRARRTRMGGKEIEEGGS